ncbi:natural resistance-associated macrophage protein-domain-containing protein [Favolaschia claudopus]|uniref:Natural resistance-associated macrophage protein-domain-containing protein n=1 Tax=Favolaschia claudopus TaxID=2862362 RepID=A0AAW0ACP0_9AGAR
MVASLPRAPSRTPFARLRKVGATVHIHAKKHAGVGIVCAVAYFDPGNWGVDLQAGSQFQYRLLFVVLLAGIFAAVLQVLATRLGCVTGLDLASHCRVLFYDRPKRPLLWRRLVLYPLYVLSEVAIISTDLAELLGSAIALCLLFPKLELWHGVLITAFDVVFLLALKDPLRSTPVKLFEFIIAGLVMAVLICMVIIISKVDVNWAKSFEGFLPSKYMFGNNALYTSVGILGATVMPHSLFLGSALATQDRLSVEPPPPAVVKTESPHIAGSRQSSFKTLCGIVRLNRVSEYLASLFRTPPPSQSSTRVKRHADRENNSFNFIRSHLNHAIFDVVGSLLGFAVLINSAILILAGTVFFQIDVSQQVKTASLFDAYQLIRDTVGAAAATVFAIALLAAGQSSSIIATVAGQAVSEGFLNWRVSPVVRRLLTRLIAVIPSVAVAVAVGRPGIDALLVASQVILAIVLPFITLPLIYLTSSKTVMRVRKPDAPTLTSEAGPSWDDTVDYSNSNFTTILSLFIWLVMAQGTEVHIMVDRVRLYVNQFSFASMLALSPFICSPCRRSLLAASVASHLARPNVFARNFTVTPVALAKKGQSTRKIPSKKAMAAKLRRRAAKEAKLVDHSDDMSLDSAISVLRALEVSRPHGCYELFVKADLRGGGIAVPKGRINIPREPKPKAEDTILVFAEGRQAEEAKRAGAQIVGGTELIEGACIKLFSSILSNRLRANTILCTPALIRAITPKLGRFLGPMGLMPAERRGTVTDDVAGYIKRIKNSFEWKADRAGNIRMPIARLDFPIDDVVKNFRHVLDSIKRVTGNVKKRDQEESKRKVVPLMKVTLSTRSAPGIPISDY